MGDSSVPLPPCSASLSAYQRLSSWPFEKKLFIQMCRLHQPEPDATDKVDLILALVELLIADLVIWRFCAKLQTTEGTAPGPLPAIIDPGAFLPQSVGANVRKSKAYKQLQLLSVGYAETFHNIGIDQYFSRFRPVCLQNSGIGRSLVPCLLFVGVCAQLTGTCVCGIISERCSNDRLFWIR